MNQKKSTISKNYQNKTVLDSILWFMENYLPQKKNKSSYSEFRLDKFESFTINKIIKVAFARSKSLGGDLSNTKITFTARNWTLPFLNLLKTLKFLK